MSYSKKIRKLVKKLIEDPVLVTDIYAYLMNDFLARMGRYNYKNRLLFVAGLPKSGTTWVETQLARVPGYNIRIVNDPDKCSRLHNICDNIFLSLPKQGYSIVKLHTRYSEKNFRIIKKYVPKFIVMIRDLRDMCVSRYIHIKTEQSHWLNHHEIYGKKNMEEGLMHGIEHVRKEYVPWLQDWTRIARENPEMILLITYEKLNAEPYNTFKMIFDFFELPYDNGFLNELASTKIKTERDLKKELLKGIGLRSKSTARKGVIGDWKNYLTSTHKERFKEIAGDLLIDLGYERDLNW